MKILYLGLPMGALMLLREGHDLVAACISRPGSPGMRRLRKAMNARGRTLLGRPDLLQPSVQELLGTTAPELVVSWFWTKRVPPEVVRLAPLGGLNVHPSLLPRHRGPDPYFWTLLKGDEETGVTAHQITSQYDEGPVYRQRRVRVPTTGNSWTLARALDLPSLTLLREVIADMAAGTLPPPTPQDESLATLAPLPDDEACEILWDVPAREVLRRVRAASPEPGAFTAFDEDTIVVLAAREAREVPRSLEPGDMLRTREGLVVVCADHTGVVITAARRDDEDTVARGESIDALFPGVERV